MTGSISGVYTLRVLAVFRGTVLRILYTPSTQVFRVRFCGCSGIRSTSTTHTPSCSIQAFGTAHTLSTPSIQAFSTDHTPSTSGRKCTGDSICRTVLKRILAGLGNASRTTLHKTIKPANTAKKNPAGSAPCRTKTSPEPSSTKP